MISPAKIRAARALLDMTREELAQIIGISPLTLFDIENGKSSPKDSTLKRIERAFNQFGVYFTASGIDQPEIYTFTLDNYLSLMDLISNEHEVLFLNADERKSTPEVDKKIDGLSGRLKFLIPPDCNIIKGNPENYRRMPWRTGEDVVVIFGDHVGFFCSDERILVIRSKFVAEDYRKQFWNWWNHAEQV